MLTIVKIYCKYTAHYAALTLGEIRFHGSCRNTRHDPGSHRSTMSAPRAAGVVQFGGEFMFVARHVTECRLQTTATLLRCVADYKLSILPPMRTTFRTARLLR
jgi:hypothetical protein